MASAEASFKATNFQTRRASIGDGRLDKNLDANPDVAASRKSAEDGRD
jgi:hypothetical protein